MPPHGPAKAHIIELYSRVAPDYDLLGPPRFAHAGRRLVELAGVRPGDRVLDLATGRGAVLFPAAEAAGPVGSVIGIDLAPGMVDETAAALERWGMPNARVLLMDAEECSFPAESFDHALCNFAVFFFPDFSRVLREVRRVLATTGRIGFAFSRDADPRWRWYEETLRAAGAFDGLPPPGDTKIREPGRLVARLREHGFRAHEVVEPATLSYSSVDGWWRSLWTHGSRRPLERLAPDALARFKSDCFERTRALTEPDGTLRERETFVYVLGQKASQDVN